MSELFVCLCLREFDEQDRFDIHYSVCPIVNRDILRDMADGKEISILDPDDPLEMYMLGCSECSPSAIEEMIDASVRCFLHPSDEATADMLMVQKKLQDHAALHELSDICLSASKNTSQVI